MNVYIIYIILVLRTVYRFFDHLYYQSTGVPNHYTYYIVVFNHVYPHISLCAPCFKSATRSTDRCGLLEESDQNSRDARGQNWKIWFLAPGLRFGAVVVGSWMALGPWEVVENSKNRTVGPFFRKAGRRPKPEKIHGTYRYISLHWHGWLIFMINLNKSNMNWMGMGIFASWFWIASCHHFKEKVGFTKLPVLQKKILGFSSQKFNKKMSKICLVFFVDWRSLLQVLQISNIHLRF